MLFSFISCSDSSSTNYENQTQMRDKLPKLKAYKITTIISDSGITRYRISTDEWLMFDKATRPYWSFPKGIYFERFNEKYQIDAQMTSKEAVFYELEKLWIFKRNVKAQNLQGEIFETEQLFWDQNTERIYSTDTIRIRQKDKIIKGIGFESNQTLTQYTIHKPQGIIPLDQDE